MRTVTRSLATALFIAGLVLVLTTRVVAPGLPPVVGPPVATQSAGERWEGVTSVVVRAGRGPVRVTVLDRSDAAVALTADARLYADRATPPEALDGFYTAVREGGQLTVATVLERQSDADVLEVDYVIEVPHGAALSVDVDAGDVEVTGPAGEVTVECRSGDVTLRGVTATSSARVTRGTVQAVDARGALSLETAGGNIAAHLVSGSLRAEAANGDVVAHVLTGRVGAMRLLARNGGITVTVPEHGAATLTASSVNGRVRCTVPHTTDEQRPGYLRARVGPGGPAVSARAVNGNVLVTEGPGRPGAQDPTERGQ
jgi:hypothetical protein